MEHLPTDALEAGLDEIRGAPLDQGRVELVVRRPAVDEREILAEGVLEADAGLAGDTWGDRPSTSTEDGKAHPGRQLTVMSARAAALIAGARERWALAGDQIYVDLDISETALPPGARLAMGTAVIEVTAEPHTGCAKFAARFGRDALRFVNSRVGRELRLRGLNARVVVGGVVHPGDVIRRVSS
ncbi:MAG: MOSC domain-containing protein [Acidimicrobiales bacterium]